MTVLLFSVKRRLVVLLSALDGVAVIHGPPGARGASQVELVVGWSPDGEIGADSTRDETDFEYGEREVVSVTCVLNAWHGDTVVEPLDDTLDRVIGEVRELLAADRQLGGLVTDVRLGDRTVYQADSLESGTSASLAFTVDALRA